MEDRGSSKFLAATDVRNDNIQLQTNNIHTLSLEKMKIMNMLGRQIKA